MLLWLYELFMKRNEKCIRLNRVCHVAVFRRFWNKEEEKRMIRTFGIVEFRNLYERTLKLFSLIWIKHHGDLCESFYFWKCLSENKNNENLFEKQFEMFEWKRWWIFFRLEHLSKNGKNFWIRKIELSLNRNRILSNHMEYSKEFLQNKNAKWNIPFSSYFFLDLLFSSFDSFAEYSFLCYKMWMKMKVKFLN